MKTLQFFKNTASFRVGALGLAACVSALASNAQALTVINTTTPTSLTSALVTNSAGFGTIGATYTMGDPTQGGTYTGFTSGPVTIGNGIVLSTGIATQVTYANQSPNSSPSTVFGGGTTPEFNAYAPGKITNWSSSHDTAVVSVPFTLTSASAIAFDFVFGSVEYPVFSSQFTDAFLCFLDGQQIPFDKNGNPVQVGGSFTSLVTTADTNTAFSGTHGLIPTETTTSGTLTTGAHLLTFEVADTNDGALDSAVFISNFHTTVGGTGPVTTPTGKVPDTGSTLLLLALAGTALLAAHRFYGVRSFGVFRA